MKKAILLLLAVILLNALTACGGDKWPTSGLGSMLPEPESGKVKIIINDSDSFSVTVDDFDNDNSKKYIETCKEKGFTVDIYDDSLSYTAFNDEGYKLDIASYNKSISITLNVPIEIGTLRWPGGKAGEVVPKPSSEKGKVKWEHENGFYTYVGDITIDEFNEYADLCSQSGFNVDYNRGDRYYRADNEKGDHLSLQYEGFNIMSINIDLNDTEPSKSKEESKSDEKDKAKDEKKDDKESEEKEEEKSNSVDQNGIRDNIKKAIDDYEAFIDEYCDFMKNYDSSDMAQLTKYASLVAKELEMTRSFEEIEDEDLTDAEAEYYAEVSLRCSQKLATVAVE